MPGNVTEENFDTFFVDIHVCLLVYELAYTGEERRNREDVQFFRIN